MAQAVPAQNANDRVAIMLNHAQWFDLRRELQATPPDSILPFLRLMSESLVGFYFNRPQMAADSIAKLVEKHYAEIGEANTLGMLHLQSDCYQRMGNYQKALDILQSILHRLETQQAPVDSATIGYYREQANRCKAFAAAGNICRPLHALKEYHIPLHMHAGMHQADGKEGHLLTMDGVINQYLLELVFDTGAGINILSNKQAEECGLRKTGLWFQLNGIGTQMGEIAFADTLRIGEMTW